MKIIYKYTDKQVKKLERYYMKKDGATRVSIHNPIIQVDALKAGDWYTVMGRKFKLHSFGENDNNTLFAILTRMKKDGTVDLRGRHKMYDVSDNRFKPILKLP